MTLAAGTRLGAYQVIASIGAGGMGEVYRATDTRLGRDVALKILPKAFTSDAERVGRFRREAQVLASLNHTNIAQIYGFEETGDDCFLVLELVEGPTLAERIARGPLPLDETVPIARQIAEGLEAAHELGILHRDLKPANIKVRADGVVKVLDFGLAKVLEQDSRGPAQEPSLTQAPTVTSPATVGAMILGTAAYMAPEQARGRPLDRRADIWAYGVVLYEMLTGRKPFGGETTTDVLAAVVKDAPDWSALPRTTPPSIVRLLRRCLEKESARRMRHIGDALLEIDDATSGNAGTQGLGAPHTVRPRWMMTVATVAFATASAVGGWMLGTRSPDHASTNPVRRFQISIENLDFGLTSEPAISPDGRRIAYKADGRLWTRALDRLEPVEVRGSRGGESPFWSPDGQTLGFGVNRKIVTSRDVSEEPTPICDIPESGVLLSGAWSEDGIVTFSVSRGSLYSVPARGGDVSKLVTIDPEVEMDFHNVSHLPGSKTLLAAAHLVAGGYRIDTISNGTRALVLEQARAPVYSPRTGHLLHLRENVLWAAPFEASAWRVTGAAFPVQRDVGFATAALDDTLLVVPLPRAPLQLVWIDRSGRAGAPIGEPQLNLTMPALSPDGTTVAVAAEQNGNVDIWAHDVARGTRARLTLSNEREVWPAWSPGGDRIAFMTTSSTTVATISVMATDGSTPLQRLGAGMQPHVSGDGKFVVYILDRAGNPNVWYSPLPDGSRPGGEAKAFLDTPAREGGPRSSPDGRWLAYVSDETGRNEVYVSRFPEGTSRLLVSRGGGSEPRWRRDGRELYFLQRGAVMAVDIDVRTEPARAGAARELFDIEDAGALSSYHYDVAADGGRFVFVREVKERASEPVLIVIENWFAEFSSAAER